MQVAVIDHILTSLSTEYLVLCADNSEIANNYISNFSPEGELHVVNELNHFVSSMCKSQIRTLLSIISNLMSKISLFVWGLGFRVWGLGFGLCGFDVGNYKANIGKCKVLCEAQPLFKTIHFPVRK